MKNRIIASLVAFIIPAVLIGMVVWMDNETYISLSKIIAPSLFFGGIVFIFWFQILKSFKGMASATKVFFRVNFRIGGYGKVLHLKDAQQKHPEKWLYPVIEYIDLNRQGVGHDDNDVYVKFKIDSALLFSIPISEYCVSVQLWLKIASGKEKESGWYEILPFEPIRELQRNPIGNKYDRWKNEYTDADWDKCVDKGVIHLGLTSQAKERNKLLLEWMGNFRKTNSKKVLAMLKIRIKFKLNNSLQVLEGSRYIAPMNDYRGG